MVTHPDYLHIVENSPWNQPEAYVPEDDRSTIQKIADALGSPRFTLFYFGFYAGCLATVAVAALWSVFL